MTIVSAEKELLAIYGGEPTRTTLLSYGRHFVDEADIQAVVDTLRSDWLTAGPKVAEFEEAIAAFVGAKYAVSFSSGTAALHAAVYTAGLGPGDEAITTPLTFAATANCLLYQGARPIFADVEPETLIIDPAQVAAGVSPKTRAILPVDYAGHPARLDEILQLADRYGLIVIEDACHALGAEHRGRRVGSVAHMTVFSFHPVKHVTTGEGGMVVTDNAQFAETLRCFRNHGIDTDARSRQAAGRWHYEMVMLGFNYRLSDIACALGLQQLKKLESNLARRRQIASAYTEAFRTVPAIQPPMVRDDVSSAWHLYPIQLELNKLSASREQVFQALRAENIGVNVHYIPVHLHPYYRDRFGYKGGEYPVAEDAYQRLISLPMFHAMTDADVADVIAALRKVIAYFRE
ncbi:MAG TPA: UDP-4-amino-4,6-dideoxy-N-acetyl-beta-L-altrosamine transaminase [Terriglobales bacterium]|nr:UDP-4-amino-4,6-dideoxy-N-acetyl-beta-L-altrosamine transaminase [Terriglobales bacterium]